MDRQEDSTVHIRTAMVKDKKGTNKFGSTALLKQSSKSHSSLTTHVPCNFTAKVQVAVSKVVPFLIRKAAWNDEKMQKELVQVTHVYMNVTLFLRN